MITIKKKNYVADKCYSSTVVFKKFPYNIRIPSYLRTVIFHNFSLLALCGATIKTNFLFIQIDNFIVASLSRQIDKHNNNTILIVIMKNKSNM